MDTKMIEPTEQADFKSCFTCEHGDAPMSFCSANCDGNRRGWEPATGSHAYVGTTPTVAIVDEVGYPDDNPKTVVGTSKPSLSTVPPIALFHMGEAMRDGVDKYGLMNWRLNRVSSSVYYNAAMRHLMAWWDGEMNASDSGVHHLAHAMACLAIILDAESIGNLNDDRPTSGNLPEFIRAHTKVAK